ncbi:MAG TPA: hypothetical protein VFP87_12875 [Chitinophagaceae bacterium]|nr:hypothetical protein [Chitinophagaceae bacterium]
MKSDHKKIKDADKRTTRQRRETLEERVHRHINDINSKITDEDIRNVKTELELRSEPPSTPHINNERKAPKKRRSKKEKSENEPDRNTTHTTPSDMLSQDYD